MTKAIFRVFLESPAVRHQRASTSLSSWLVSRLSFSRNFQKICQFPNDAVGAGDIGGFVKLVYFQPLPIFSWAITSGLR